MNFTGVKVKISDLLQNGCTLNQSVLVPKYGKDWESFKTISLYKDTRIKASQGRSVREHNMVLGIIRMCVDNGFIEKWFSKYGYDISLYNYKKDEKKDDVDTLLWFLKWEYLPHIVNTNPVTGERYEDADSISFHRMDGTKFRDFKEKFFSDVKEILSLTDHDLETNCEDYL